MPMCCRRVEPPKKRKSVGAEVNWGVRFQSDDDARRLLDSIGEGWAVFLRLAWLGLNLPDSIGEGCDCIGWCGKLLHCRGALNGC